MQHLATHDGPGAAPCPLCFSPLTAKDLRSLEAVPAAPPAPGRPSSFALVRCPKGSGHPRPAASGVAPLGGGGEDVREEVFSKLSVTADATPVFLHDAR